MTLKSFVYQSLLYSTALCFCIAPGGAKAQSQKAKYSCQVIQGVPRTVVDTTRGRIELVAWKNTSWGADWTPKKRCDEVSSRFQKFADAGTLRYITTGKIGAYNVICVGDKKVEGYKCKPDGLLLTLRNNDNPSQVMNELFDVGNRQKLGGIQRGGAIDLNEYLLKAPTMANSRPSTSVSTEGSNSVVQPSPINQTSQEPPSIDNEGLEISPLFQ